MPSLLLNGAEQMVDGGEMAAMPDEAAKVAGTFAGLRDDILERIAATPGFGHAVRLTRLIGDMVASSCSGARMSSAGQPGQHWAASPSGTAASQARQGGQHLRICKGAGPVGTDAVTSRSAAMTLSCVCNPAPAQVVCPRTRIVARAILGGTA